MPIFRSHCQITKSLSGPLPSSNEELTYDDYIRIGDEVNTWKEALPYYEKALELKPNDPYALWSIATAIETVYGDYETAWNLTNDALNFCGQCSDKTDIQEYLVYLDGVLNGEPSIVDSDFDGIPDNEDACPNQPEDNWTFDPVDGCPESGTPGGLDVEVSSTFFEFISYMVRGSLTESSDGVVSGKTIDVILLDQAGNEVTSQSVTTKSDGSFYTSVGAGSFPGPHTLIVKSISSQVTKNIQIKPLDGQQPICQGYSDTSFNDVDINSPVNDSNCFAMRYGDKVSHGGSVSYGETIQLLGKSMSN